MKKIIKLTFLFALPFLASCEKAGKTANDIEAESCKKTLQSIKL